MVPHGDGPRDHPLLKALDLPRLGWARRGFPLVTQTLLFTVQEPQWKAYRRSKKGNAGEFEYESSEGRLRAFHKATGELIWETELPNYASGGLMTYMVGGRQYIVVPVGGAGQPAELIALGLEGSRR